MADFNNMAKLGLGAATLGIVVVMLSLIMTQVGNTDSIVESTVTKVTNESVLWQNASNVALSYTDCVKLECSNVYNDSANSNAAASTAYVCNTSGITYTNTDSDAFALNETNYTAYVNYNCFVQGYAYNASRITNESLITVTDFLPIVLIALMGFFVVFLAFRRR